MGSHPRLAPLPCNQSLMKQPAGRWVVQAGKDLRLMQGVPRAAGRALTGTAAVTWPPRILQGLG